MDTIQFISFFSSIITLLLFILFIAGRIFRIKYMLFALPDACTFTREIGTNFIVKDGFTINEGASPIFIIAKQGILWLKIYKYRKGSNKKDLVWEYKDKLFRGRAVDIRISDNSTSDYLFVFKRYDYLITHCHFFNGDLDFSLDSWTTLTLRGALYYIVE